MNFKEECFNSAVSILPSYLKNKLFELNCVTKSDTYEIRLRTGKPLLLCGKYGCLFFLNDGSTSSVYGNDVYICKPETVTDTFNRLCCYSVYSHIESIVNGYITYQGGHRAGIVGTAVTGNSGDVATVKDISALNIRISKEIIGSADRIVNDVFSGELKSVIIAGPPSSGKTTVLRDLVRQLSDKLYKICLMDERQEIACMNGSICQNDVGINTDVFNCYPKNKGIMNAIKTMSPQLIAIDEVGEKGEIEAITQGVNTGVQFITTVHAMSYKDLLKRPQMQELLTTCSFDYVILLNSSVIPGEIEEIYDAREIYDEIFRSSFIMDSIYTDRDEGFIIA